MRTNEEQLSEHKKSRRSDGFDFLVDNSYEISNIGLTPRDIIDTHHIMTLIMKR